ncbi:2-hydroxyacid dehydrogenase [Leptolyngbya ohadii]|uniref:2-hydroxyacid dehydrogenase n=1 Tax=Leptolyngbya ohadii TaxID=1962290 RepID=UPI000B5A0D8D|nr:2-hydroxyacid dehydrogenase [Leptolyngbya ohadii]
MKVAVFSTRQYDRQFLEVANYDHEHELVFFEVSLDRNSASLANRYPAVCLFVNDVADATTLEILASHGVALVALRCAGFNNVDLRAASRLGIRVVRVPAYSPYAVAEHVVAMIQTLNRKTHRAYNRVREGNFSLEGLLGYDLHGRTVGVVGTGKIGQIFAQIMQGFGCRVLGYDLFKNPAFEAIGHYVQLPELLSQSDIISLHCPLTPETYHLINQQAIEKMKLGAMLINTSRGGLVDTEAAIEGLKSHKIGALGLDVYEQESDLFFEDLSNEIIQDDLFERLTTFPNVLITAHQAFFTKEALENIAETTLQNITDFEAEQPLKNEVKAEEKIVSKSSA